jgi:hypothetical protein
LLQEVNESGRSFRCIYDVNEVIGPFSRGNGEELKCINEVRGLRNRQFINEDEDEISDSEDSQFNPNNVQDFGSKDPDPRAIGEAEISHLVNSNKNLNEEEKNILIDLLKS